MLRVENGKLYVGVMITDEKDNVWSIDERIKAKYWTLIDIETDEKDFVCCDLIKKDNSGKQKEMSKYIVEKTLQYKDYLINDIKNEKLPLQKN